jgi:hypothetical protein
MAGKSDHEIDQTITKNLGRLSKYGVLTVRPGYEIAGHQLTGKRAIVATVHTKKAPTDLASGDMLPDTLGGVPVDVRQASGYQRLRAADPLAAEISQAHSRPEDAEPEWPLEREVPSGEFIKSAHSETQKKLKAQTSAQPRRPRLGGAPEEAANPVRPARLSAADHRFGDRERDGDGESRRRAQGPDRFLERHDVVPGGRDVRLHLGGDPR